MKADNALFYTCSLIEFIGRKQKLQRSEVIRYLGDDLRRIYSHADVFHCEPIEKVAYDFIERDHIPQGTYDPAASARFSAPDYWDLAEVFERLIEDCYDEQSVLTGIRDVYNSWMCEALLNFDSDLYYQPRDYLAACYREGVVVAA